MNYSRRQLEALGEPLGESVTRTKPGGRIYGSGGGGHTTSTVTQQNIPDWLRPQTEALLGGATKEFFQTKEIPGTEDQPSTFEIQGIKPYVPYSVNARDYVAGFSPMQQQVFSESANMQRPAGFGYGSELAGISGLGGLESASKGFGYGQAGFGAGQLGQQLAVGRGGLFGNLGAGYGMQSAGMGGRYEGMATSPGAVQSFMSPYQQNVIDMQKQAAIRDYDVQAQNLKAQAARSGAYGGSRQAIQAAEAQRNLNAQLQNIENTGRQSAYDRAIQSMQFGTSTGLQGLQGAQAGLSTALQGVQQQLAGTAQGMQGAQAGLQGVSSAQAGYGLTGQAAQNLANIGRSQQEADIARMGFQGQQGQLQRTAEQDIINQSIQNYALAQQYPAQQLAAYNALLRGQAAPATTVSQYQAAPSGVSQLAGLGLGAYGLSRAIGSKKGGKIEDKDAEGIDDILIRKTMKKVKA
jgi:hypothetical protein